MSDRYKNEEILRWLYWDEEQSVADIGDVFDVAPSTILYWMEELDIERRKPMEKRVPKISKDKAGYERFMHYDNRTETRRTVFSHRLLAVAEYGLEAIRGKDVHHKNGCKFDNRPDNIELLSRSEHRKRHAEGELVNG